VIRRAVSGPLAVLAVLAVLPVLVALVPAHAHASPFDLVFADSIVVVAPPSGSGFTLGNDIALIANPGPGSIGEAELAGAIFTATSSDPAVELQASILNPGSPATPILTSEAVGTPLPGSPLLGEVLPGETVRNIYPVGLFRLAAGYPTGFSGTVRFDITMAMGIDIARCSTVLTVVQGTEPSATVVRADRVSSTSFPIVARASTWGSIKQRYR
jgi:hypothetical protein